MYICKRVFIYNYGMYWWHDIDMYHNLPLAVIGTVCYWFTVIVCSMCLYRYYIIMDIFVSLTTLLFTTIFHQQLYQMYSIPTVNTYVEYYHTKTTGKPILGHNWQWTKLCPPNRFGHDEIPHFYVTFLYPINRPIPCKSK